MASHDHTKVETIVLQSEDGSTTATLVPDWGANVIALSFRAESWAWPVPILERVDLASVAAKPTSYGIPILGPTPGRVGKDQSGQFTFEGKNYTISPPRHGFLRDLRWTLAAHGTATARLRVEVKPHRSRGTFPYHFEALVKLELSRASLRHRITIKNTGKRVQPLHVGWHPYLHRPAGDARLMLPAAQRWEPDAAREPVPTGERITVGKVDDFRKGRILPSLERWDDVFTGLEPNEEGWVKCWLETEENMLLTAGRLERCTLRRFVCFRVQDPGGQAHPLRHVQLYTPPGRNAVAIEPLSAPPDAINLHARGVQGVDLCRLEPGHSATFEIVIGLEVPDRSDAE